jgi:hypothetical protein
VPRSARALEHAGDPLPFGVRRDRGEGLWRLQASRSSSRLSRAAAAGPRCSRPDCARPTQRGPPQHTSCCAAGRLGPGAAGLLAAPRATLPARTARPSVRGRLGEWLLAIALDATCTEYRRAFCRCMATREGSVAGGKQLASPATAHGCTSTRGANHGRVAGGPWRPSASLCPCRRSVGAVDPPNAHPCRGPLAVAPPLPRCYEAFPEPDGAGALCDNTGGACCRCAWPSSSRCSHLPSSRLAPSRPPCLLGSQLPSIGPRLPPETTVCYREPPHAPCTPRSARPLQLPSLSCACHCSRPYSTTAPCPRRHPPRTAGSIDEKQTASELLCLLCLSRLPSAVFASRKRRLCQHFQLCRLARCFTAEPVHLAGLHPQ